MSRPTVGSFCTGVGGLDLAVEAHFDAELAWYSEVEPAPITVLEREWPGVPNLGDLTTLDWSQVEPVDIITAGYPCQPFSHAGKRKGASDARHLWPFIAEAVRVLRPRWVVLENVAGHLTLGFGDVLGDLAEAGFDAEWCVLRASDVGAAHGRPRVFVVATNTGSTRARGDVGGVPRAAEEARRPGERVRAALNGGSAPSDADGGRLKGVGEPDLGSVEATEELRARRDADRRRAAAPVALLPTPMARDGERYGMPSAATAAARVLNPERSVNLEDAVALLPTPAASDGQRTSLTYQGGNPTLAGSIASLNGQWIATLPDGRTIDYGPAVHRWQVLTLECAPTPRDEKGRLHRDLPRWMMGYPRGWLDSLGRTAALKAAGNAVVPQQAAAALRELAPLRGVGQEQR